MVDIIFIAWRKKSGGRRHLIARIKRTAFGFTFEYREKDYAKAKTDGLEYISGFQDIDRLKTKGIIQENDMLRLLSLRVIGIDKSDSKHFLDFWEASNTREVFELVALTQGKSPTDNLEFLAHFHPKKNFKFVTDLAGLTHLSLPKGSLEIGDKLTYERDHTNEFDPRAIAVFNKGSKVGYIKQVHNKIFCESKKPIALTVKALEQNGLIKQVFVKAEC